MSEGGVGATWILRRGREACMSEEGGGGGGGA